MTDHNPGSVAKAGIALAALAIAMMAWGALTSRWFTAYTEYQYSEAGLRGVKTCMLHADSCDTVDWSSSTLPAEPEDTATFRTAAKITLVTGAVAALLLALSALLLAFGKYIFRPMAPSSAAILACIAAVASSLYTAQKNPLYEFGLRSDISLVAFALGAGAGFLAAVMIGRERPEEWF